MPTFNYFGTDLTLDYAISYARVSSAQQSGDHGGAGIERQLEAFQHFTASTGIPEDTAFRLVDDGRSASKGKHLKDGALGLFLNSIGKVKLGTALVIESFSRLTRLPIDEALDVFFQIVTRGGVTLITLQDRRAYTKASLRGDKGAIHGIAAAMMAARDLAENISYYSTRSWKGRRGSITNVVPGWIIVENGQLVPCPIRAPIIQRAWAMGLMTGVNRIVHQFNAEGVQGLNERKRSREQLLWSMGTLTKIFRGRQVLGQQEVAHYVDGRRVVTKGQYVQAYPAIISQEDWDLMQAKLDGRRSGTGTGRNVTRQTNLFGDLARCECGSRMKINRRGNHGEYVYLGCSARHVGGCDNTRFFRLDKLERIVLPKIVDAVLDDEPAVDPTAVLTAQITAAKAEAATIERAYKRAMLRTGDLAESTQADLETEHARQIAAVTKLERQLAALTSAKPVADVQALIGGLLGAAVAGDVAARAKIAAALPEIVNGVVCRRDGTISLEAKATLQMNGMVAPVRLTWKLSLE